MTAPVRIGVIGLGKISVDQHLPAIRGSDRFVLAGGVSPLRTVEEVRLFECVEAMLASGDIDAVAVNTPPQVRHGIARAALLAGKDVLLEKPPCASTAAVEDLAQLAAEHGAVLYTAWHSQHAPGVESARAWLASREPRDIRMEWCEDVRQWHPGQTWIWEAGGFGVFDPAINGLSILTRILPRPLILAQGRLDVPSNRQTPISADLSGTVGEAGRFSGRLDFLRQGRQAWSIEIETDDGLLRLEDGGGRLFLNDVAAPVGECREYASIYARFADLIANRRSEVDIAPLRLVADAFLLSQRLEVEPFIE